MVPFPAIPAGLFPLSDQFPLGRPLGAVEATPEPPTEVRPFGLTLAVPPRVMSSLDIGSLGYDEEAQVGLVCGDGARMVPLARHTDGQTNTQTKRSSKC